MRGFATALCLVGALLWCAPAPGSEAFPGQVDLAAGLACHRNLDNDCAQARLERALAAFSPELDPHYLLHVRTARWVLAQIHVAADDLDRAEQELFTLFEVDPGFDLPPGDHPPKLRYVFEMARRRIARLEKEPKQRGQRPPDRADGPDQTDADTSSGGKEASVSQPFRLQAVGRVVGLFGDDAEAAMTGPGAGLRLSWLASDGLLLGLAADWARHPLVGRGGALQSMALSLAGMAILPGPWVEWRLGAGLGAHAMGTRDRYDHWGLVLSAQLGLAWPAEGPLALTFALQPSLLITAGGSSFFLPAALGGEFRW